MGNKENKRVTRRQFMRNSATVAAGLAPAFAGITTVFTKCKAGEQNEPNAPEPNTQEQKYPHVPKRKLGKTGVKVPCLGMGVMFNLVDNQVVLSSALKYGVTYLDTASNYAGGNSELGIGKYLEKNPQDRKNLFIVSKASRARTVAEVEENLQLSLKRMKTDYIDGYFPHGVSDPAQFTDELKQWVESAKKRKLIRFFGFSTHSNSAKFFAAVAKLGWIDMIMMRYNFRLFENPETQAAIDACHKAKIGLIAMKAAGRAIRGRRGQATITEADKKLMEQLLKRGFTQEQAAIKLVLQDERISCACVGMENVPILTANVAAVLDKTKLTQADRKAFTGYAKATCSGYCAGCAEICDSALPEALRPGHLSDIMRYLMYYNSYGDKDRARALFAQIPGKVRNRLLSADYSAAEACCPQRMPIGELVAEAVSKLA